MSGKKIICRPDCSLCEGTGETQGRGQMHACSNLRYVVQELREKLAMYEDASAIEFDHEVEDDRVFRAEADLGNKWTLRDGEIAHCYLERGEAIRRAFEMGRLSGKARHG